MFQSILRPLSCSVDKQFLLRLGSKFFNFFKKASIFSKFFISGNDMYGLDKLGVNAMIHVS